MVFKIENCNYYVIKELLQSSREKIADIKRVNPETTVVKLTEGNDLDDLMSILNRHPLHSVVSNLKISSYL